MSLQYMHTYVEHCPSTCESQQTLTSLKHLNTMSLQYMHTYVEHCPYKYICALPLQVHLNTPCTCKPMFRNWFNSYSTLPYQMPIRFVCSPLEVPSGASLFITKASPSEWMLGGLADATFAKLEHAVLVDEQCRHCVEGLSVCIHRRLCIYIYIYP